MLPSRHFASPRASWSPPTGGFTLTRSARPAGLPSASALVLAFVWVVLAPGCVMTFRESVETPPPPLVDESAAKGESASGRSRPGASDDQAAASCRARFGDEAAACFVVTGLIERIPGAEITIDDALTLRVRAKGHDAVLTLERLDARLRLVRSDAELRAELERWLHSTVLLYAPDTEALDASRLRLVPKPHGWAQKMARSDNGILRGPDISPTVETVVVLDYADRVRVLTVRDVERLGRSGDDILREAREHMAAALTSLPFESAQAAPGVFIMESGDAYAAARLLLPELWHAAADVVEGPLVVVPATRDTVLFASGSDVTTVQLMLAFAAQLALADLNPVSAEPLRWTPTGFVAFEM